MVHFENENDRHNFFRVLMSKITDNHFMYCISIRFHQVYQDTVEVIIVRLILVFDLGYLHNEVSDAMILEQTLGRLRELSL